MAIEYKVRRRRVGDIELLFYTNDELIMVRGDQATIFHNWFERNTGKTFRPFKKCLMYQKSIGYREVFELADHFGVSHTSDRYGKGRIIMNSVEIDIPSKGRSRNKELV